MQRYTLALLAVMGTPYLSHAQDDKMALGMIESAIHMLKGFDQFSCDYDNADFGVASLDDIITKKYTRKARVAKYKWLRKREKELLIVVQDEETTRQLAEKPKLSPVAGNKSLFMGPVTPFRSSQFIQNDTHWLQFNGGTGGTAMVSNIPGNQTQDDPIFGCLGRNQCEDRLYGIRNAVIANTAKIAMSSVRLDERQYVKLDIKYDNGQVEECYLAPIGDTWSTNPPLS